MIVQQFLSFSDKYDFFFFLCMPSCSFGLDLRIHIPSSRHSFVL